ncbi:MAG: hypothetical protein ABIS28_17185 [Caldimonas sp.]
MGGTIHEALAARNTRRDSDPGVSWADRDCVAICGCSSLGPSGTPIADVFSQRDFTPSISSPFGTAMNFCRRVASILAP